MIGRGRSFTPNMATVSRSRHAFWPLGAAVLHIAAAVAAKPQDAPLPVGYPSDSPTEYVNGLFVHAKYENWGFSAASQRVMNGAKACRDKGREPAGLDLPQV